jgi:DNA-binding transcriptional ArsR family regulator
MSKRSRGLDLAALFQPELYRALRDSNRIAILGWLARESEPRSVSEVARSGCCAVDFSVISRHLAVLKNAGVLEAKRSGKEVRYSFRVGALVSALRALADALESCCGNRPQATNPAAGKNKPGMHESRRSTDKDAVRQVYLDSPIYDLWALITESRARRRALGSPQCAMANRARDRGRNRMALRACVNPHGRSGASI